MNLSALGLAVMNGGAAVAPLPAALPATIVTVDPGGLLWTEIDPGRTVAVPVDAFAALDPAHTIGE